VTELHCLSINLNIMLSKICYMSIDNLEYCPSSLLPWCGHCAGGFLLQAYEIASGFFELSDFKQGAIADGIWWLLFGKKISCSQSC
jgi:hypothetical protein